jgi:hypothetical protein
MNRLTSLLQSNVGRHSVSLLVGLGLGVFLHYLLFRLSLPIEPFIYVSF